MVSWCTAALGARLHGSARSAAARQRAAALTADGCSRRARSHAAFIVRYGKDLAVEKDKM
jgi:hypothetical protein